MKLGQSRRPVVLCILDGWGIREDAPDNAITRAQTPIYDHFVAHYPYANLRTSGHDVGLPEGQFGNSEVGHTNIGAGRVVLQDLRRIDTEIANNALGHNPALCDLIARLSQSRGVCHILGLLSKGGVHGHRDHVLALANIVSAAGIPVKIHAILDGRDVAPISADEDIATFLKDIEGNPRLSIATIAGRYYALDRDKNWDRIRRYYQAVVCAQGKHSPDPPGAIKESYSLSVSDEFVLPTIIGDYAGIKDQDGLLIANFRADRIRQITVALVDPDFHHFERLQPPNWAIAVGMTEYSRRLNRFLNAVFPPLTLYNGLGEIVSSHHLKQLRIAETEKYAHVTYFFNGGRDIEFEGEDRLLIPSPRVRTYDMKPDMSAFELTKRLVNAIKDHIYDLIIVNYANPDMVGHTGILPAAIKAVETVDTCLGQLHKSVMGAGGMLFVTADHGNAEMMYDPLTGQPHTSHTTNLVPAILVDGPAKITLRPEGRLCDIAPTLLELLGIPIPQEMTGTSLLLPRKTP